MNVLGLDTSGYINAVGVIRDAMVVAEGRYKAKTDSLEQIVDNIDAELKHAGMTLADIDGIGVGLGPGSWTGIRVGVTVGKMLAFSTGKPICGISTLDALAFVGRDQDRLICAVIEVGAGGAVYAACYRPDNGTIRQIGDYYTGSVPGLVELFTEQVMVIGKESERYADELRTETETDIIPVTAHAYGSSVAALARLRLENGEQDDALSLTPLYLKEATARAFVNKYAASNKQGNNA